MDWRSIGIRAAKTALQSFLAVATAQVIISQDVNALRGAAVAALAAGYSVIQNALLTWSQS